jgi:hypothetical protein
VHSICSIDRYHYTTARILQAAHLLNDACLTYLTWIGCFVILFVDSSHGAQIKAGRGWLLTAFFLGMNVMGA